MSSGDDVNLKMYGFSSPFSQIFPTVGLILKIILFLLVNKEIDYISNVFGSELVVADVVLNCGLPFHAFLVSNKMGSCVSWKHLLLGKQCIQRSWHDALTQQFKSFFPPKVSKVPFFKYLNLLKNSCQ